jgi:phage repressor protein C with HTH and peptisase S24 domain
MSVMPNPYARVHNRSNEICTRELAAAINAGYALRMERSILAANIAALRLHLKDNQAKFAARLGVPQSYVSRWETRDVEPKGRTLARIANLAGVPVDDFVEELWQPATPDLPPTISASDGETAEVAALDLSFSMGPGTSIDDYIEEMPVRFDIGFLRQISRAPPARLRLAKGLGDSMFPTLLSGDRVMIDTTQTSLNLQDRIWAISLHGAAAVKRLRSIGGGRVLVISDNPTVDNQEVGMDDLSIGGRVVWSSREH